MTERESRYYKLNLIREVENAIIRNYPTNDIKTPCHLAIGAESIAVGVCESFPESRIYATYRNHHWYVACGGSIKNFFLELYGKQNPIADGKAGSMHLSCPDEGLVLTSAVVASQIGPAVGHAFAMKYKNEPTFTICALGDGALEEGVFFECLNLAKLYNLKILFVIEDNNLAIHQKRENRQAFKIRKIAEAYSIQYVDGFAYDLENVLRKCTEITKSPAILHLRYHRFKEHVGINEDYKAGYREEPKEPHQVDPVKRFSSPKKEIDARIQAEINEAIKIAKEAPLAPKESLLEHVFA